MSNQRKKRKLVINTIREYFTDRNLESIIVIERDVKAVEKVINRFTKRSDEISSINSIDYRIIKAETQGLMSLLNELNNHLELKKKAKIPLVLIRYMVKEEDIKTKQSIKLIIKTWLNIITVQKKERPKILIAFKSSLSNDIFGHSQCRVTKHKADQIANAISNLLFSNNSLFNSRKIKDNQFLNTPYGGYTVKSLKKNEIEEDNNEAK